MDLAKPSDWRMADRSPCLVLGKSCRGGCGNEDDERPLANDTRRIHVLVTAMATSEKDADAGGESMVFC